MELEEGPSIHEARQLCAQAEELYGQGRYKEAITPAQRAFAIYENVLGPEHPDTATALNDLAALYLATFAYAKAEPLFQRALAIREKAFGPEHLATALSLSNLAGLYRDTGAYTRAEPFYQRALAIYQKALGPEHPDTATALHNLAQAYRAAGTYTKAEPLFQRALAISEKALGPEHPDIALLLNNLAGLYDATGAYAKAEPLYQRALAMREKTLGPEHPDTALSLNNLAEAYRVTGAYANAEPLLQRALAIYEKALGPEHPDTALALNNLAGLYNAAGAYAKAEPLFQRALAISEKALGPEHPHTAGALNNLAALYNATGAYTKAEPLLQRALATREKALGPEHLDTANALSNLASLYHAIGVYAKAEPLLQRALAVVEKALGPEHPRTAGALNNLAVLYSNAGAYTKAEPVYQRALAISEKSLGPEHPDTALALNNLAGLYRQTGAYTKAEPLYQRALAISEKALGPEHPATATALNNLAGLYRATHAYTKAEPPLQRALAIREKTVGPEHPHTASALNNLAMLYSHTGAYTKAEPVYQRALAISEKALGPEHPDIALVLNNLAALYHATFAYAKAEPLFQRALAIREKALGPEHPDTAKALNNLAGLYHATGAYTRAEPLYERAQVIEENNTARFLPSVSERRKQAYLEQRLSTVYANVSSSLASPTARSKVLGLTSVLQYKGRVLDAVSDGVARLRRSVAPKDLALFDQLSDVAQRFSTLASRGLGNLSPEAYRQRLDALAGEQEQLQTELSSRSALLRQAVTPISLEGVQRAFPADAVLVEWFRYSPFDPKAKYSSPWDAPRYVAYVLKHTGEPVAIDLGAAQPIEDLVAEFRTALSDPASTYFKEVAKDLSEKLITPLRPHFAQNERLLLSPDGALNLVPFAALSDEAGEYLVQHFEITYLTSGRDLLRMDTEPPPRGTAVVLANPNYGQPPSGGPPVDSGFEPTRSADLDRSGLVFTPLPGTAAEATALQNLLKLDAQNVLTNDRATEAKLRQLHGPRIVHMATHGFFLNDLQVRAALRRVGFDSETLPLPLSENPLLRSGLALAGANARQSGATDDGILTAAEAAQLDLLGTQLVALSACETGVGTVQAGEGVYGLRRALVLAGAQTQLVSLWKVADAATQELMVDYYQRLLKGEGRSGALRAAQKAIMAKPARQHPCYWASFIPIGDWTPLPTGDH
jgi:CHAT domain-containing protein/Tfp pilus assembly protein PilF